MVNVIYYYFLEFKKKNSFFFFLIINTILNINIYCQVNLVVKQFTKQRYYDIISLLEYKLLPSMAPDTL